MSASITARGLPLFSSGRVSRLDTRSIRTSSSALSQMETPFLRISARRSVFIKAPPPVATILGPLVQKAADHPAFAVAKIGLAMISKNFLYCLAGSLFYLLIGVDKWNVEPAGESVGRWQIFRPPSSQRVQNSSVQTIWRIVCALPSASLSLLILCFLTPNRISLMASF